MTFYIEDISFRGTGNTQNWLCSTPGQLTALSLQFKWLQKIRFLPNFKLEKGESFFAKSARGLGGALFSGMGKSLDSKYVEDFAKTHFSRLALFDAVLLLHALQMWGPTFR